MIYFDLYLFFVLINNITMASEVQQELLEEFPITYEKFLDRLTCIYGGSSSGKSVIIRNILKELQQHADEIIVICPSDPVNETYSKNGLVKKPLIHYKLTAKLVETIWARQEMKAAVYARANNMAVLESLFMKLNMPEVQKILNKAKMIKKATIDQIQEQYLDKAKVEKEKEIIDEKFTNFFKLIYHKHISENKEKLSDVQSLTADEKFSVKYIDFNPRLVLVLDDCTSDFTEKEIKRCAAFKELFFRGRHAKITTLIACHDDKNLESDLRKNAFCNVFTTPQAAFVYFKRGANGFDTQSTTKAINFSRMAFIGHQKLVFVRDQYKFYKMTAKLVEGFEFGSVMVNEFCRLITVEGSAKMDRSNEFYKFYA